jgi:hypothetical protein
MAQADYVVANGTGAAVRSDLNGQLAAIVSNNSGATEPATMYAYQWWADTTTGLLKLRNSANSAWVTIRQLDGEFSTVPVENGTAAAPSIYFKDSGTDSGFFSPGTDAVAISTAGANRLHVTSAGLVGIGTSSPSSDGPLTLSNSATTPTIFFERESTNFNGAIQCAAYGTITFYNGADSSVVSGLTPRMTIDGQYGNVGIGTTDARGVLRLAGSSANAFPNNGGLLWLTDTNAATDYKNWSVSSINGDFGVARASDAFNTGQNAYKITGTATQGYIGEHIWYTNDSSEKVRVDNSGRLLIGTASDLAGYNLQVANTSGNGIAAMSYSSTGGDGAYITLYHSKSGTVGTHSTLGVDDDLGIIQFSGSNGTAFWSGASIKAEVDAAISGSEMPGRLVFSTTSDSASSPTERFRISSDGSFSSVIPGGSTLYPQFGCRAWVNFNGTGTVAIRASGNVSSITDNGTGDYTVNFTTAMPDANYSTNVTAGNLTTTQNSGMALGSAPTTTNVRAHTTNGLNAAENFAIISVAIFR